MKKVFVSTVALLLTAATLSAQPSLLSANTDNRKSDRSEKRMEKAERKELTKPEGAEVSTLSKNNFYSDFGNIPDVSWNRGFYFDEATFKQGNATETAYYDDGSNLVGTTTAKTFDDLSENVQKDILKKYKDCKVENVVFFDDNEHNDTDMFLYGAQFEDADTYFVELSEGNRQIILTVSTDGVVSFFKQLG